MPIVKLDTGFNIEIVLPITPFHKRLLAWVIDGMVQTACLIFIQFLIEAMLGGGWQARYPWLSILVYMPVLLYHLISEIAMNGQSLGKKALGVRVITMEGGQPSLSQYIIRWVFKSIDLPFWMLAGIYYGSWPSWMMLFLFAGLACILITRTSQRIGDLIAGTVLVDTKNNTSWEDTVFREVEENYVPVFPQVMQLSDRDINSIRQVLSTMARRNENYDYTWRIAQKIQAALKIETALDPVNFMELLLKDYNHLSTKV